QKQVDTVYEPPVVTPAPTPAIVERMGSVDLETAAYMRAVERIATEIKLYMDDLSAKLVVVLLLPRAECHTLVGRYVRLVDANLAVLRGTIPPASWRALHDELIAGYTLLLSGVTYLQMSCLYSIEDPAKERMLQLGADRITRSNEHAKKLCCCCTMRFVDSMQEFVDAVVACVPEVKERPYEFVRWLLALVQERDKTLAAIFF
ncbi:MAG: hypothetical protein QXI19_12720, partial [Candidatus Caldarchaeum sp.]